MYFFTSLSIFIRSAPGRKIHWILGPGTQPLLPSWIRVISESEYFCPPKWSAESTGQATGMTGYQTLQRVTLCDRWWLLT